MSPAIARARRGASEEDEMSVWSKIAAVIAGGAAALAMGASAVAAPGGSGTSKEDYRFFEAMGFVDDFPDGYSGSVVFRSEVRGEITVALHLSRALAGCEDGSETIYTEPFETSDGLITLDVNHSLREAHGVAVVDLVHSVACGEDETVTVLPAQEVRLDVVGAWDRLRTHRDLRVSSRGALDRIRDYSLISFGTGVLTIDAAFDGPTEADEARISYDVERFDRRGEVTAPFAAATPPGGVAAEGWAWREYFPPDGLGLVWEEWYGAATVDAAPARTPTVGASTLQVTGVPCPSGETGYEERWLEGWSSTGVTVEIDRTLASALASGPVTMTETVYDGCTGEPTSRSVTMPVTVDLAATAPAVRYSQSLLMLSPSNGPAAPDRSWAVVRSAAGTVSIGAETTVTDEATISRAGR